MNAGQQRLYEETNVLVEVEAAYPGFVFLAVGMGSLGASLNREQAVEVARQLLIATPPPEPMTHADLMAIVADDGKEGPDG